MNEPKSPGELSPVYLSASDYLAAELERLMALPLASPAEVERWFGESGMVQHILGQRFPGFEFEHEVWHFFSDADIRAHDDGYRER